MSEGLRGLAMVMESVMAKGQEGAMASAVATMDTKGNSVWTALMDTSTSKEMTLSLFAQVNSPFSG